MTSGDQSSSTFAINSSRQSHFPIDVELISISPPRQPATSRHPSLLPR
jgi:hypothetical protein